MSAPDNIKVGEQSNESYDFEEKSDSEEYVSDLVDEYDAGKVYDEEEWNMMLANRRQPEKMSNEDKGMFIS